MRRLLPLLVVSVALAPAGCGGGSSRLSHAEFAKSGNSICTGYFRRLRKLPEPKGPQDLVSYVSKAKGYTQDAIDDLEELEPPKQDEDAFRSFLSTARQEVALEEQLIAAARANNLQKVQSLANRGSKLDERANAQAKRAGLRVCGSSSG